MVEKLKVRVKKEDKTVNGIKWNDVAYYYFDVEDKISLRQETVIQSGHDAGKLEVLKFLDYDVIIEKYLMPLTIIQTVDDAIIFELHISDVVLNPMVNHSAFKIPE